MDCMSVVLLRGCWAGVVLLLMVAFLALTGEDFAGWDAPSGEMK